jgi:hypothetical protein
VSLLSIELGAIFSCRHPLLFFKFVETLLFLLPRTVRYVYRQLSENFKSSTFALKLHVAMRCRSMFFELLKFLNCLPKLLLLAIDAR